MPTVSSITISNNFDKIKEEMQSKIPTVLEMWGLAGERNAKLEVTTAVYDTPESPNYRRTGNLRNSITHTHNNQDTAYIGTDVEYAAYVEMGTIKMPPRPYLKPAVENHVEEYKQILESVMKG